MWLGAASLDTGIAAMILKMVCDQDVSPSVQMHEVLRAGGSGYRGGVHKMTPKAGVDLNKSWGRDHPRAKKPNSSLYTSKTTIESVYTIQQFT